MAANKLAGGGPMMLRLHELAAVATSLMLLTVLGCSKTSTNAAPSLSLHPDFIELTTRTGNQDARFQLTNDGAAPLVITQVEPRCGCVKADVESRRLAPGESTTLSARISAPSVGVKETSVVIHSNDPKNPQAMARIAITLERDPPYVLHYPERTPIRAHVGRATEPLKLVLSTAELAGSKPWIARVSSTTDNLQPTVSLIETSPQADKRFVRRQYQVDVSVADFAVPAHEAATILLSRTNDGQAEVVCTMGVTLDVEPLFRAIPNVLYFSNAAVTKQRTARFAVLPHSSLDDVRIESVSSNRQWINVTDVSSGTGRARQYQVSVPKEALADRGEGMITLTTSSEECPTFQVRVVIDK
jgi:hypothetical protein